MVSERHAEPLQQPQTPPSLVRGRYEIGPLVGSGGTASVYQAYDCVLGQDVAVKLFHPGAVGSDERRLKREMNVLGRLRHPGVVTSYAVGTQDEQTFMVMQLVDGETLADRLRFGALRPAVTVALGCRLADTLAHVHTSGVTHRDLKPANVLLGPDGALISDFGIAQLVDDTLFTTSDEIVGTACYMSPEQVEGDQVGPPTDVYALGLVLLECLTGRREYIGDPLDAAVARLHRSPAIPDGIPDQLSDLLHRMTSHSPQVRPSASEVCACLRSIPLAATLHAKPIDTGGPTELSWTSADTVESAPRPLRRSHRARTFVVVASAAALAAGVFVALFPTSVEDGSEPVVSGPQVPSVVPAPVPTTPPAPSFPLDAPQPGVTPAAPVGPETTVRHPIGDSPTAGADGGDGGSVGRDGADGADGSSGTGGGQGPGGQPTHSEPTGSDPTDSDPTDSDPTGSDPTDTEPTDSEPTSEPTDDVPEPETPPEDIPSVPDVTIPSVDTPDIPDIDIPDIDVPDIDIPGLS